MKQKNASADDIFFTKGMVNIDLADWSACNGDKGLYHDCEDVGSWECYVQNIRDDCCVTCENIKNNLSLPIQGCQYGDRIPDCGANPNQGAWLCYNNTIRADCCDTCYQHETGNPDCRFGDRVPGCLNKVGPHGRDCYNTTIEHDCCDTCFTFETNNPDCLCGDKSNNCQYSECPTYATQKLQNCCGTCYPSNTQAPSTSGTFTWTHTPSTTLSFSTTSSPFSDGNGSGTPGWVIPVAASIGGVVVLAILIVVACYCIRRRPKKPDAISDEMYKQYKLSKRAPVAPPRPDVNEARNSKLKRQDSAEYAYIHPDNVASDPVKDNDSTNALKKRDGNDPLPKPPVDYVYLTNRDKYGYLEAVQRTRNPDPYTHLETGSRQAEPYAHLHQASDEKSRRSNSYGEFPLVSQDNRGFNPDSDRL